MRAEKRFLKVTVANDHNAAGDEISLNFSFMLTVCFKMPSYQLSVYCCVSESITLSE